MIGVSDCLKALEKIIIAVDEGRYEDIEDILSSLKDKLKAKSEHGFPTEVNDVYRALLTLFREE